MGPRDHELEISELMARNHIAKSQEFLHRVLSSQIIRHTTYYMLCLHLTLFFTLVGHTVFAISLDSLSLYSLCVCECAHSFVFFSLFFFRTFFNPLNISPCHLVYVSVTSRPNQSISRSHIIPSLSGYAYRVVKCLYICRYICMGVCVTVPSINEIANSQKAMRPRAAVVRLNVFEKCDDSRQKKESLLRIDRFVSTHTIFSFFLSQPYTVVCVYCSLRRRPREREREGSEWRLF